MMDETGRRRRQRIGTLGLLCLLLGGAWAAQATGRPPGRGVVGAQAADAGPRRATADLPVIDLSLTAPQTAAPDMAAPQMAAPIQSADPTARYPLLRKDGPPTAAPGSEVVYTLTLANYDNLTHTYRLTDTLPAGLVYRPAPCAGMPPCERDALRYDPATRQLVWEGRLGPGHLDYQMAPTAAAWPSVDLGALGAPNLCALFYSRGERCADALVTFNLGSAGYTAELYGNAVHRLTVASSGVVLGGDGGVWQAGALGRNRWLPAAEAPNFVLAGLWRDVDMGTAEAPRGRWHAAVLRGWLAGHDVFLAQWQDAAPAGGPDETARHSIAVVLNGVGGLDGHLFYLYERIADPAAVAARGYSIGIEDGVGQRGRTHAYAACCGDGLPPQGYPPAAGTTLHLWPELLGDTDGAVRRWSYRVRVTAEAPADLVGTAYARSDARAPELAWGWSTHYLAVRRQVWLPVVGRP